MSAGAYKLNGAPAAVGRPIPRPPRAHVPSQPYLVQERAQNHPAMRDLSNGALNTIRLLSCLDEQEQPEIIGAVLRIAVGDNVTVDNVHAGGLAAADRSRRRAADAQATDMGVDARLGWTDRHPQTGAVITGRLLPMWDEVRELVRKAHLAFRDRVVIGWDIAIMADGRAWSKGTAGQTSTSCSGRFEPHSRDGRLGELLAFHLNQCESSWRT